MSQTTETSDRPIEKLFSAAEVERRVLDMGTRLERELGDEDPLFLSLVGGSLVFLADLVRAYGAPARYELVQVGYTPDQDSSTMAIEYPIPVEVAGESLVVLKDVVHSGVTESYLAQHLRDKGAAEVRFVALVDIPQARTNELALYDRAFATDRTGTLVGYGLKHDGRHGNLPYIGYLPGVAPAEQHR